MVEATATIDIIECEKDFIDVIHIINKALLDFCVGKGIRTQICGTL